MNKSALQVAHVNDDGTEVVLNYGSNEGFREGLQVLIYRLGPSIKDPESGKDLGRLEEVLGTGTIVHVQKNISTVKSNAKTKLPDKKRTFDDKSRPGLVLSEMFGRTFREEIIQGETITAPFKGVKIEDYAKVIG